MDEIFNAKMAKEISNAAILNLTEKAEVKTNEELSNIMFCIKKKAEAGYVETIYKLSYVTPLDVLVYDIIVNKLQDELGFEVIDSTVRTNIHQNIIIRWGESS